MTALPAAALVLLSLLGGSLRSQQDPSPPSREAAKALARIQQAFAEGYADDSRDGQRRLAAALLESSHGTTGALERRVQLDEARRLLLAARGPRHLLQDVARAQEQLDDGPPEGEAQLSALAALGGVLRDGQAMLDVSLALLDLAEGAIVSEDLDLSERALECARTCAPRGRNEALHQRLDSLRDRWEHHRRLTDEAHAAWSLLEERGRDDPFTADRAALEGDVEGDDLRAAHASVGRFLCELQGDWEEGLAHLALAGDVRVAAAVDLDLDEPDDGQACKLLADRWWECAQAARGWPRELYTLRALHWYREALPDLGGLDEIEALGRLDPERDGAGDGDEPGTGRRTARRPDRDDQLARWTAGASVAGTRHEVTRDIEVSLSGEVLESTTERLVIRFREGWRRPRDNRKMSGTFTWTFERVGDPNGRTGAVRLRPVSSLGQRERKPHRTHWRGELVLDGSRLRGEFGYDWPGQSNPKGTATLTERIDVRID